MAAGSEGSPVNPDAVSPDRFAEIVAAQMASLPEWVREAVREVAVLTEDEPAPEVRPPRGVLFGRYYGVPLTQRGRRASGSLPDTIVLYRRPIVQACRTAAEVPGRARRVLLHEIGHALGMTERRLREMGVV